MGCHLAIVGVTGAVGQELLSILEQRCFPFESLKLLASSNSVGKQIAFMGRVYTVEELCEESFSGVDIAIFGAGRARSRAFAPAAVSAGAVVVDNSSVYRMEPTVPLIIPEINAHQIGEHQGIIANPNCPTIIGIVPVWPLHQINSVLRMVVSTYQPASSAGMSAMYELENQSHQLINGKEPTCRVFPHQIAFNCFNHNSVLDADGYNQEELQMVHETRKILDRADLSITATCVRIPVLRVHCQSINLEFLNPIKVEDVREILAAAPGVTVLDDRKNNRFPMPINATGQDDVLVGRIRRDDSLPDNRGINLWVAGDQLRKGSALNAIQIAERLLKST